MADQQLTAPDRRQNRILVAMAAGAFMNPADHSAVVVILPQITREFSVPVAVGQWVILVFLTLGVGCLPLMGRYAGRFDPGRLFLWGLGLHVVGAATSMSAMSLPTLLVGRAIQGVASALMPTSVYALIGRHFPPHRRGRVLGLVGSAISLGLLSGPAIAGLTGALWGWRAVFACFIPVTLAALALARLSLPPPVDPAPAEPIQIGHGVLAGLSLVGVVTALAAWSQLPWLHWRVGGLAALGLLGCILFYRLEQRPGPTLFARGTLTTAGLPSATATAVCNFAALAAAVFLVPYLAGYALGMDLATVGTLMAVYPATSMLLAPISGRLSDRVGPGWLTLVGMSCSLLGLLALAAVGSRAGFFDLAWRVALLGAGFGLFQAPNTASVLSTLPAAATGTGGALLTIARILGTGLGTAMAAKVFSRVAGAVDLRPPAALHGFQSAMWAAAAIAALGVALTLARALRPPSPR